MTVVLDASAAIRAVLDRQNETAILAVLDRASPVITTDLFVAEVASGLWKYIITNQISIDDATANLDAALDLVSAFYRIADFAHEALREAGAQRHPVYDLYYIVLARRENAAILTTDGRMKEICRALHVPLATS
jgi:predicted nucleic acid-binding protein